MTNLCISRLIKSPTCALFPQFAQGDFNRGSRPVDNWVLNRAIREDLPHLLFPSTKRFTPRRPGNPFRFPNERRFSLFCTANDYYYGVLYNSSPVRTALGGNAQ
jgi:hypothetical protein